MHHRNRKGLVSFLFLLIVVLPLIVTYAEARTEEFYIQPEEEIIFSSPELASSERILGNISVQKGLFDFHILSPSENIEFQKNQINNIEFNLTASENGNYTFLIVNSNSTENLKGKLVYGVQFKRDVSTDINLDTNVGYSIGVARVITIEIPSFKKKPQPENPYKTFLNFMGSENILSSASEAWGNMPLGLKLSSYVVLILTFLVSIHLLFLYYLPSKPLDELFKG